MQFEEPIELEGLATLHQFPATEDDKIVYRKRDRRLFKSTHRSNSGLELKALGRKVAELQPDLLEYRPYLYNKGTIEGWKWNRLESIGSHLRFCKVFCRVAFAMSADLKLNSHSRKAVKKNLDTERATERGQGETRSREELEIKKRWRSLFGMVNEDDVRRSKIVENRVDIQKGEIKLRASAS